ncbi:hypothetical protein B5F20_09540 [Clostridium perfringens]|uniref:hypothetical protein n=1 Tax=Clostridium perfringens TaxID=1502 RepID=UPI000B397DC4|nr:hypothetical protein [Clostridium perfringens]OUP46202.1 hypothetical protein B5F20_09540 [Clostridium perfringens]
MIKINKTILNDKIEFDLSIKLTSKDLYSDDILNVDISNLILNGVNSSNKSTGILTLKEDKTLLTIMNKDLISLNGWGIDMDITEYSCDIKRKLELKKAMLIQQNTKKIRADYLSEKKHRITRSDKFGYFIKGENILDENYIELERSMNSHDAAILSMYPKVKEAPIELTLKEIVKITNFKNCGHIYVEGENNND